MAEPAQKTAASIPGAPARTITALANIPTPRSPAELAYLTASQQAVCESLALVLDIQAAQLQKALGRPTCGSVDRFRASTMARIATAPMKQAADRARASGASSRACWRRFLRVYDELLNPQRKSREGGFHFPAR